MQSGSGRESDAESQRQRLQLKDAVDFALSEARMVLPGIQAIFGFQLIVTFNDRFASGLTSTQQHLHLGALFLTGVAMALVMAPAAYHRHVEREAVSAKLLRIASRLIASGMNALAVALSVDVYIVVVLVTGSSPIAIAAGAAMFAFFVTLWVVYPAGARRSRRGHRNRT